LIPESGASRRRSRHAHRKASLSLSGVVVSSFQKILPDGNIKQRSILQFRVQDTQNGGERRPQVA